MNIIILLIGLAVGFVIGVAVMHYMDKRIEKAHREIKKKHVRREKMLYQ